MLPFFPKPYPDELLYSIIARYHVWSGNNEMADTMEQLFNNRRERATVLIPQHLSRISEKTSRFGLDFNRLLYQHTVFPYLTCFMEKAPFEEALSSVYSSVQEGKSFSIYKHNLYPRYLRYCPVCIREDRGEFGEVYWHRMHQSYGISVCVKHACYLYESNIEILDNRYLALELIINVNAEQSQGYISNDKNELQIACDIDYIYSNYEYIRDLIWNKYNMIRETTIALLFKRELATKKGHVRIDKLQKEFYEKYCNLQSMQLLDGFDNDKKSSWVIKLCRGSRKTVIPIRYILFADFLAGSFEKYINLIIEQEQFIDRETATFLPPTGFEEKLLQYRQRWLGAWEHNPNGLRIDLVNADRPAYTWLRRHDNDWMIENSPQKTKPKGTTIYKYWAGIDNELQDLVEDAVTQIKDLKGKPERITKASIYRHMQRKCIIERNAKSLPMTMHKINASIESTYEYRLRKIAWAKDEFDKEGKPAIPWMILKKAGIRDEDWYQFMDHFTF